ncbi:MAG: sulfatase-like hydrolase/transferase [Clostridia bacterium]|nr:sulfatase-like hydrolase/transferase [Clostridia bacterium]
MTTDSMKNIDDQNCDTVDLTRKPNFLIIMVDEQRFPPPYEDDSIKEWRAKHLKAQNFLRRNGVEFKNHYAGSTACSPSRTTLYTGQYPSLHGVTQTDGGGGTAFGSDMFWLDSNTVPTFGDYLRTAGYHTFWKGKWHASHPDILIPGTHDSFLSFDDKTGIPIPERERLYLNANRLNDFGFDGWIGPEPHGSDPHNSGSSAAVGISGRDVVYSAEVIELLNKLQQKKLGEEDCGNPWAIVASFVNPHDIALFGAYTRLYPTFNFEIDSSVPPIPPSPTSHERLDTKPKVQASYRRVYPEILQPLADTDTYRRLYYSLQLKVDQEIYKVIKTLRESVFYQNTVIIYTSDHGDMLGAHGGLFQKWYVAYEEAIHVPLIIHNPRIVPQSKSIDALTSHVDILPTMLELAGIDPNEALEELKKSHTEAHPLVGKSLAQFILDSDTSKEANEPVYFMTDDDPSKNLKHRTFLGKPFEPVVQPSHIETVIVKLPTGINGELETWKYSRYFDNPQFWSSPGEEDKSNKQECSVSVCEDTSCSLCVETVKTAPVPDEIEMYNLTLDPIEAQNLANPEFATKESEVVQVLLEKLLAEQCHKKRIYPSSGDVPGKPSCKSDTHEFMNL